MRFYARKNRHSRKVMCASGFDADKLKKKVFEYFSTDDIVRMKNDPVTLRRYLDGCANDLAEDICAEYGLGSDVSKLIANKIRPSIEALVNGLADIESKRTRTLYQKTGKIGLSTKLIDYYATEFPDDSMIEYMDETSTFNDLFEALDTYNAVEDVIGVKDSTIRERLFYQLAKLIGQDYDYVYEQWMNAKR